MNKIIWDGLAFSAITIAIFAVVQFILSTIFITIDSGSFGFPLEFYSFGWGAGPMQNRYIFSSQNFYLNTFIAFAIGFAASCIKNSVVKK